MNRFPGILAVGGLATLTVLLGKYISLSSTLIAILLGFVVGNMVRLPQSFKHGIKWVESQGLTVAVALLGIQLNLSLLLQINTITLVAIAVAIVVTFIVTFLLAKWMHISGTDACLVASGQAICGSAAVMATTNVLNASKLSVGLTIAVVNFLGFIGIFIAPWLSQQLFPNDAAASGFLIGNTLQSMGHVVAAGFTVSDEVGQTAVLIKMCRILFLIPTLLVLIFWVGKSKNRPISSGQKKPVVTKKLSWLKLVPLFIWGFLGLVFLSSMGWVSKDLAGVLKQTGDLLFVLAMVAIGLGIRVHEIWQHGSQLLLLACVVFLVQIGFTVLIVLVTH